MATQSRGQRRAARFDATLRPVAVWPLVALVSLLTACAATTPAQQTARAARDALTPATTWSTPSTPAAATAATSATVSAPTPGPKPTSTDTASITQWWKHFDDPLLAALIDDAQASAPAAAQALARVREARANAQAAGASLAPAVGLAADASRGASPGGAFTPATQATAGLQAQWELDLFGGLRHRHDAARWRAEEARFDWHEARVALAADVAQTYVTLRSCEAGAAVFERALASMRTSADLTREKVRVGFEAPANAALATASAADAANRLSAQRADCESLTLTLSVLSGRSVVALREALMARRAVLPQPVHLFEVDRVPASVLAQRPDIAAAEQALAAAEADIHSAQAARWPKLVFGGSIGLGLLRVGGIQTDGVAWSFLPSLSLPIFDGGRIAAGIDAAQARRDMAHASMDARVRNAVRDIEEALVRLDAARNRESDAMQAAQGFRDYFEAAQSRWRVGAGSLIEMEDARRLALNAQGALIGLQRERVAAWISLYRATGGGWRPDEADAMPTPSTASRKP